MHKTLISLTEYILLGYLIYILVTAVLLFAFSQQVESMANESSDPWISETTEKVMLVEDRSEALKVRLDIMDHAEETLDISYYSMQGGDSVDLFYAHILKAADRGVKVRFLLDGLAHNMRFANRSVIGLFSQHPNIELSFYEPLDLIRPWTWNNRLHDKFIIADQMAALIGGRNIGDKYFAPDDYQGLTNDRDLLLFNQDQLDAPIIKQMKTYFDHLWEHDFVKRQTDRKLTSNGEKRAERTRDNLMEIYRTHKQVHPDFFNNSIDWAERSHDINRGFFVHNSIDRFLKDPQVWNQMLELISQADKQIMIQSPYFIPNRLMRQDLDNLDLGVDRMTLLTNGVKASPNVIAHSGYRNHRENLLNTGLDLYEYQHLNQSLHMKSVMIDQQITAVGSFNFDPRSVYLNTESMLVVDSPALATEISDHIEKSYIPDSLLVGSAKEKQMVLENVSFLKRTIVFILRPLVRLVEFLL